ncbi:hypothetical protein, partial [Amycolatopsis sp. lyj-108]|uniref:hypothetical protein n=1 Tax=Amycolatopsis sp. lyj-108 TaxID=2789286 RepID=UPI00397AD039
CCFARGDQALTSFCHRQPPLGCGVRIVAGQRYQLPVDCRKTTCRIAWCQIGRTGNIMPQQTGRTRKGTNGQQGSGIAASPERREASSWTGVGQRPCRVKPKLIGCRVGGRRQRKVNHLPGRSVLTRD